jgi:hypothetical protein
MHARRLALANALAAGAFALAACSNVSMPGMPQMPQGQMPQGQMPQGQMPQGQMPQGQMPQGQMPQGQMPQGQMPQGQMPQGQMPQGMQMPQGQMQMPQGQMPQGAQMAQGAQGMIIGALMAAKLSGAAQVPPNSSSGSGTAAIKLDGDILSWVITYSGLTGPVTGAHFHGPAAANANSGVVVPFAGSLGSPIQGSQRLTPTQIAQLRSGLWYVNLHTAAFPGGEIRGQVTAAQ